MLRDMTAFDEVGRYTRFERVGKVYIVDTMPETTDLPDGTLIGYYSATLPSKKKIIPRHHVKFVDDVADTETAFTRGFMKQFPKRKIRGEEFWNYKVARPPMYVKPAHIEDGVYIDIRRAYPSIYKYLGWNTDYLRGKYWGVGEPLIYPFPMEWKAGRSYVVSGSRHMQFGRYVDRGRVVTKKYYSQFSNPPLVAGVYDVLSMIARFAQYSLNAFYWNVDGGIFHSKAKDIFLPFLESIGLEGSVKFEGPATILSSGYWRVGDHKTKNYANNRMSRIMSGDWIPVDKNDAEWIYTQFRKITERNK